MKKIRFINYIWSCLTVASIVSCSDYLNQEPVSNSSVSNFGKTETDIEQAVAGAYNSLKSYKQYGSYFIYFMEVCSDNTAVESFTSSGGIYGDIDLFRATASNNVIENTWAACYEGIQRCNMVLNVIDEVNMDEITKNKYKGEVLFIRALTYFNLVRIWGDIPLVTQYVEDPFDAFAFSRTPSSDVYNQIVSDLQTAAGLLPQSVDSKRAGSVLSGSANTLLGKVYLTMKDFSNAALVLKKVIDSNQYALLTTYDEVFDVTNKNSKESIFEIQYNKDIIDQGSAFANMFAPRGSSEITNGIGTTDGNNTPTSDLYKSYEEGDLRKDISIGKLSDNRLYCKKFVVAPVLPNQSDANFIVLRYADVLLMYAEALNEIGYSASGEAFSYLNSIRKRAGLNEYTSDELSNQNLFRNAVWKERRFELAFENHRWFDLVRTGTAIETMNASEDSEFTVEPFRLIFPIPQSQIDVAPGVMIQNQNY